MVEAVGWPASVKGRRQHRKVGIAQINQRKRYGDLAASVYGGGKPPPYKDGRRGGV